MRDAWIAGTVGDLWAGAADPGIWPGDPRLGYRSASPSTGWFIAWPGGEQFHPPAAGRLGSPDCHLRVAPYLPGQASVRESNPDAGGQGHIGRTHTEWEGGHAPREPFGNIDDLLGADRLLDQDGELVTAPARHRVLRRHRHSEPASDLGEQEVGRAVADRVDDNREVVHVHHDDRGSHRLAGLWLRRGPRISLAEHLLRALLDIRAVRQPGQPIMEGEVRDLPPQCHLGTHVPRGDQQRVRAPGVPVARHTGLDMAPGAIRGPHPARIPDHWLCITGDRPAN